MTKEQIERAGPFMELMTVLEGCNYASQITEDGWWQRALALAEVAVDFDHGQRIVDKFMRTPRYDEKNQLITTVPSAIELRLFAGTVSALTGELPAPCPLCAQSGGTHRTVARNGVEFSARCGCVRGEVLKRADEVNRG